MLINTSNLSRLQDRALQNLRRTALDGNFQLIEACRTSDGGVSAMGVHLDNAKSRPEFIPQRTLQDRVADVLDELTNAPANCRFTCMVHPDSETIGDVYLSVSQFIGGDVDDYPKWFNSTALVGEGDPILPLNLDAQIAVNNTSDMTEGLPTTKQALIEMGGTEWRGGPHHRVYFNDSASRYGLVLTFFGTGNVSSARVDNEKISNREGTRLNNMFNRAEVYFDVKAKEFIFKHMDEYIKEEILRSLTDELATYNCCD